MRFFRRRWDEDRGDAYASWGPSWWYFATDDAGVVEQQAEIYDNGCVLVYDSDHAEDEFGGLSEQPLDLDDFAPYEIDATTYAHAISGLRRRTS
jgi:hypothetical protein